MRLISTGIRVGDRDAWRKYRNERVGGSSAASACGFGVRKTRLQIYLEATGELEREDISEKVNVRLGSRAEQNVADEYAYQTGRKVRRVNQVLRHADHDWMIASLDRLVVGEKRVVECKNVDGSYFRFHDDWGEPGTDQIPNDMLFQCQHYLGVTGYPICDLAVIYGGNNFALFHIERDEDFIANMIRLEADYIDHLVRRVRPEPDFNHKSTLEIMRRIYPGTDGTVIELSPENVRNTELFSALAEEKATLSKRGREIESAQKALKSRIEHEMKEAAVGLLPDGRGWTRKPKEAVTKEINYKARTDVRLAKKPKIAA